MRYVKNPAWPCIRTKKSGQVTDRAKRYRANQEDALPAGPRRCNYCGVKKNVVVHHVQGTEDQADTTWACRSCNTRLGRWMKRVGIGKRTRQYNPGKAIPDYSHYMWSIGVARGVIQGDADQAWADILATDPELRSRWTRESWGARKAIYGPRGGEVGRPAEVPF